MTSACPPSLISTISVTALSLRFCRLNDAFAIDQGTVLSFSPEEVSQSAVSVVLLEVTGMVNWPLSAALTLG
jgi:hypothetical protein